MTLLVFILVVAIVGCCAAFKWRNTSRVLYAMSLILFLAVGCGPVPVWLLRHLQATYAVKPPIEWGKRNAIIVLGAGTEKVGGTSLLEPGIFSYGRITEAAALYNDCRKTGADCKIMVSGGDAQHHGASEAEIYQLTFIQLGIDAADVLREPNSMNTWQNAQFTSAMLRRYKADRQLLVSSGIHLRRSMLYFAHFGVSAIPVRADYMNAVLSALPLSYNFAVADFALHEYTDIARYRVYSVLGWNAATQRPGKA